MAAGAPLDQLPASAAAAAAGSAAPGTLAILSRRTDASAGGPAAGIKAGGDSDKGVSSLLPLVVAPGDLLLGLAAGLDMRFGCRVNRVTYGKKGVTVSTLSGGGGGGPATPPILTARLSFIEAKAVGCIPIVPLFLMEHFLTFSRLPSP